MAADASKAPKKDAGMILRDTIHAGQDETTLNQIQTLLDLAKPDELNAVWVSLRFYCSRF